MFQLNENEFKHWKSQIVISNSEKMSLRKPPMVFTEQGIAMLSSVLRSDVAILVNIQIIRVFSRLRESIDVHRDVLMKLENLEQLTLNHDKTLKHHRDEFVRIFVVLKEILDPDRPPRKQIGYKP